MRAKLKYAVKKVGHSSKKVWSKKFEITPAKLKAACHSSKKVAAYLTKTKKK